MELVLGLAVLVALVLLEPFARAIATDVAARVREWRAHRKKAASESDALEIFLRSRAGRPTSDAEWQLECATGHAWVSVEPDADQWALSVAVAVDAHLDLEIRRPRFSKRLRVAAVDQHVAAHDLEQPDIRFDVRRAADERGAITERLFSHAGDALTEPLALLLYRLGGDEVVARSGRLGVRLRAGDLLVERVRDVLAALEAVAAAYARRPEIRGLAERYLWLEGSSPRCPYCHVDLVEDEPGLTSCARCKTVHHEACFDEHGGCTLLGCSGQQRS